MPKIFISDCTESRLQDYFVNKGYDLFRILSSGAVQEPVSCHPDMFMCRLGISNGSPVVVCPDIEWMDGSGIHHDISSISACAESSHPYIHGSVHLCREYPHDIAYNAACTGRFFIHNLKYTDPVLLETAKDLGMILIDVRQGYAKCSTVIVDSDSIITYDRGLGRSCSDAGIDVLTVAPGHVKLPGFDSGFIGGACGRIDKEVIFNGNLEDHPDFHAIIQFIHNKGLEVKWFREWPLTDTGSFIQIS